MSLFPSSNSIFNLVTFQILTESAGYASGRGQGWAPVITFGTLLAIKCG